MSAESAKMVNAAPAAAMVNLAHVGESGVKFIDAFTDQGAGNKIDAPVFNQCEATGFEFRIPSKALAKESALAPSNPISALT